MEACVAAALARDVVLRWATRGAAGQRQAADAPYSGLDATAVIHCKAAAPFPAGWGCAGALESEIEGFHSMSI
jgi:hypothetical protein